MTNIILKYINYFKKDRETGVRACVGTDKLRTRGLHHSLDSFMRSWDGSLACLYQWFPILKIEIVVLFPHGICVMMTWINPGILEVPSISFALAKC